MSTRTFGSKIGTPDPRPSIVPTAVADNAPDGDGVAGDYAENWSRAQGAQVVRAHTPPLPRQRDILEKDETTLPLPNPSRQNKDNNLYETFVRRAGFTTADARGSGDVLTAGSETTFRAGAVPEKWRVIITSPSPATVWIDPGESFSFPSEFVVCAANGMGVIIVPGRGLTLTVKADAANAGAVTMTATALAGSTADTI